MVTVLDDVTVVIRSCGERTQRVSVDLLEGQVRPRATVWIRTRPFATALQAGFEASLAAGRTWTACIDADILPRAGSLQALRGAMEQNTHLFAAQGRMLDKLLGGVHPGGIHFYRTSLLKEALIILSAAPLRTKRPETYVLREMARRGYPWLQRAEVTGLHGFEQYYRDVCRAGYWQARKRRRYLRYLLPYWQRAAQYDFDFAVALQGYELSLRDDFVTGLDAPRLQAIAQRHLSKWGITEKRELSRASYRAEDVERTLHQWVSPHEYWLHRTHAAFSHVLNAVRLRGN